MSQQNHLTWTYQFHLRHKFLFRCSQNINKFHNEFLLTLWHKVKLNKFHFLTFFLSFATENVLLLLLFVHFPVGEVNPFVFSWTKCWGFDLGKVRKKERKKGYLTWSSIWDGNSIHNVISPPLLLLLLVVSPRHHLTIYDFQRIHSLLGTLFFCQGKAIFVSFLCDPIDN